MEMERKVAKKVKSCHLVALSYFVGTKKSCKSCRCRNRLQHCITQTSEKQILKKFTQMKLSNSVSLLLLFR